MVVSCRAVQCDECTYQNRISENNGWSEIASLYNVGIPMTPVIKTETIDAIQPRWSSINNAAATNMCIDMIAALLHKESISGLLSIWTLSTRAAQSTATSPPKTSLTISPAHFCSTWTLQHGLCPPGIAVYALFHLIPLCFARGLETLSLPSFLFFVVCRLISARMYHGADVLWWLIHVDIW